MRVYPALHGTLGTWEYYLVNLPARDLVSLIEFGDPDDSTPMDEWRQRALNKSRAKKDIGRYLACNEDHFFSSIVVAARGGNPTFFPAMFQEQPMFEILDVKAIESKIGVLRFDGSEKYYALDGQHRLLAIKELLEASADAEYSAPDGFENEEYSVLIVTQQSEQTEGEFLIRQRRLFSHLNRYAKAMDRATTLVMEEDDAIAIVTRRLIAEHVFFNWFVDLNDNICRIRCRGGQSIPAGENTFTTIISLYEMNKVLLETRTRNSDDIKNLVLNRPNDDELDSLYDELSNYWDAILETVPALKTDYPMFMRTNFVEDGETDEGQRYSNHMLFRPLMQPGFCRVVRLLFNRGCEDRWNDVGSLVQALLPLKDIDYRLHQYPWNCLLVVPNNQGTTKMRDETRKPAALLAQKILTFMVRDSIPDPEEYEQLYEEWTDMLRDFPDTLDPREEWDKCMCGIMTT